MKPYLSIVIPAYNEETLIEETLQYVIRYLEGKGFLDEILVVCDGCKDNTAAIAKRCAQKNDKIRVIERKTNKGKGYSVREGCLKANGEYIVFTDADLSTPIEETEKILKWLQGGYDIAIGSRALKESDIQVHQSWYRETMGKIFNLFVQALAVKGIKDTQCGFKGFKKEVVKEVFPRQTIDGFSFDVEVLYIARKLGYKIKDFPVRWLNRAESKVNPLTHSLQMFVDLLKIRIKDWKGDYE